MGVILETFEHFTEGSLSEALVSIIAVLSDGLDHRVGIFFLHFLNPFLNSVINNFVIKLYQCKLQCF